MIAQPLALIEHVRPIHDPRLGQAIQHSRVDIAVVELVQDRAARVLKRRYGRAVAVTDAVDETQCVHAIGNLLVASVHRIIEEKRAVEVAADYPPGIVVQVRLAQKRPENLREPQLGIVRKLDWGKTYAFQCLARYRKRRRVNRYQPEPLSVVPRHLALKQPAIPLPMDRVHPIQRGRQKRRRVHRPLG